ncbi:MAG: DUF354 domain-containing protein [Candidatus Moduliflexus flocculans]|nr:DUF354 domain-containing protein [Candidatus Moduliflexus flocculans]
MSGGGTMNREAAALGVPVYSIFRGKTGAVDIMLEEEGRLGMIRSKEEVWSKIRFVRRDKNRSPDTSARGALRGHLRSHREYHPDRTDPARQAQSHADDWTGRTGPNRRICS